jgi:DNA helicase-2/ATP-dependent DNA helicase PcrA
LRLDPAQQAAVESEAQNLLIVAGAGSGKTRVLVERMMHLARRGTPANRILATTFTKKAALEMEARLTLPGLRVGTFHSVLWEILRNYTSEPRRQIMDDSQRRKIASQIAAGHGLEWKSSARVTKDFLSTISLHKNFNRLPDEFEEAWNDDDRVVALTGPLLSVWRQFEAAKDSMDLTDFDDILLRAVRAMRDNQALLDQISGMYDYFLVDEYQDTNEIQEEFVGMMIAAGVKTTVVGDYRQSIYRFRGANVQHIMSFTERYPQVETIYLRNNYRSRAPIVELGNEIISHNTYVIEGAATVSTRGPGAPVEHITTFDADDQAESIADRISRGLAHGLRPRDVAILMPSVKTGSAANKVEAALLSRKIPYTVHRGTDIFDTNVFQQCLSVFQAKANLRNIHALRVAYECLPGIGETTASKIVQVYQDEAGGRPDPLDVCSVVPKKQQGVVEQLARLLDNPFKTLRETFTEWRTLALDAPTKQMQKLLDEERDPFETLGFLVMMYDEDITIADFIDEISLSIDEKAKEDDTDAVFISTIHRSKGLEFPHVFVTGLEEGVLPRADAVPGTDLEDEARRVFYVACTRAEETLTLFTTRMIQGKDAEPSRFLAEIPEHMLVGRYLAQERSPGAGRGYSRGRSSGVGNRRAGRR